MLPPDLGGPARALLRPVGKGAGSRRHGGPQDGLPLHHQGRGHLPHQQGNPLAVSPDNTAAFQAAIWDAARNAFVPTSHVAFTTACLDKGAAATVEVKEGRIVLTPNKEYLDQQAADVVVKVTYGVISTGTPDPTPGTATFSVVLTADDDAPVSQAATVG